MLSYDLSEGAVCCHQCTISNGVCRSSHLIFTLGTLPFLTLDGHGGVSVFGFWMFLEYNTIIELPVTGNGHQHSGKRGRSSGVMPGTASILSFRRYIWTLIISRVSFVM